MLTFVLNLNINIYIYIFIFKFKTNVNIYLCCFCLYQSFINFFKKWGNTLNFQCFFIVSNLIKLFLQYSFLLVK